VLNSHFCGPWNHGDLLSRCGQSIEALLGIGSRVVVFVHFERLDCLFRRLLFGLLFRVRWSWSTCLVDFGLGSAFGFGFGPGFGLKFGQDSGLISGLDFGPGFGLD